MYTVSTFAEQPTLQNQISARRSPAFVSWTALTPVSGDQRRDKEAVRPMYREFRELEAKIASISAASASVPAEADSLAGTPSGDPTPGDDNTAVVAAGDSDGIVNPPDVKKERDAKKREIKQWIKEFEEREGHTPSTK